MTSLASIIIPVASYHQAILPRAVASAEAQSVSCPVIVIPDGDGLGAGWARNTGAAMSDSLFLVFLDADDYLEPDAVELMLSFYQPGHYIYCDDYEGDSLHQTPDSNVYLDGSWHSVTCLVPRSAHEAIGGFDESLPLLEDKDYYLRLQSRGVCGIRCPSPLLHYTNQGQRSGLFPKNADHAILFATIEERYKRFAMSCCGEGQLAPQNPPQGEKQEGDVLVTAMYEPQVKFGPATGRSYPRPKGPYGYRIWVSPLDYEHPRAAGWWRVTEQPRVQTPNLDEVMRLAGDAYKLR